MVLFLLMLNAGMPELDVALDVTYLRTQLMRHLEDAEAAELFRKEINNSVRAIFRQLDNMVHTMVHY